MKVILAVACVLGAACGACRSLYGVDPLDAATGSGSGSGSGSDVLPGMDGWTQDSSATTASDDQSSLMVSLAQPVAAGDLIVVAISTHEDAVGVVTDSSGANAYMSSGAPVVAGGDAADPLAARLQMYYAVAATATTTLDVTLDLMTQPTDGSGEATAAVLVFHGRTHFDTIATAFGQSGNAECGPFTPEEPDELDVAITAIDGDAAISAGPAYTIRASPMPRVAGGPVLATEDGVGQGSAEFDLAGSGHWACEVAAFR